MAYTDSFRRHHQEILALAGEITDKLRPGPGPADPKALRMLLSGLAGKLSVHLAMEDKALYPRMIQADHSNSKALAQTFMTEMGGLGEAFAAYNKKWQASQIGSDPAGFAKETQTVFGALARRIEREDNELYPLADRIKLG